MTPKERNYYWNVGKYFGYPECCINSFIFNMETSLLYRKPEQLEAATHGYVPCPSCARKLIAGEVTVDELVKGRTCSTPFPAEPCSEFDEFINSFKLQEHEQ